VVSHSFPDARREIEKLRKSLGELNAINQPFIVLTETKFKFLQKQNLNIQTSKRLLRQNSSNYSIAKFDNLGHRTSPVVRSSSSLNRLLPSGSRWNSPQSFISRVQITWRAENFRSRRRGALFGLFWRLRIWKDLTKHPASASENSRYVKLSAHDCIQFLILSQHALPGFVSLNVQIRLGRKV
jgi:hypothetical protein